MAVLTGRTPRVRRLVGAEAILGAHGPALPQPDQLCGPFAAWAALHAVMPSPPSVTDLAVAAGTRIWPYDVAEWRPAGAPLDRTGWDRLPQSADRDQSGTDGAGLTRGIASLCAELSVIPARGPGGTAALVSALVELGRPVGVVANLRTGPVAPTGLTWDVGHFVVLWGVDGDQVAVADSYTELGAPDLPLGCRLVSGERLDEATAERGLLLLVAREDAEDVSRRVAAAGLVERLWRA